MVNLAMVQTFLASKDNLIPIMGWESELSSSIGLSIDQFRFTFALILALPVGMGMKLLPSPTVRHLYSLVTGLLLTYYPFGFGVIHAVIPGILTYIAMLASPKQSGLLAWAINFPYLIYLHVVNASGESWQAGEMDFTGCQMVVVLKLISLAMCFQDSRRKAEDLSPYQAEHAVRKLPNPLEYCSFLFCIGNLLAGPYMEYRYFKEFICLEGIWSPKAERKVPSSTVPALKCLLEAIVFAALYMSLNPLWNRDTLFTEFHANSLFVMRMCTMFMITFTMQLKFVFAWKLSESALTLAGFNFEGYIKDGATGEMKAKWGRFENARFVVMLMSDSARICPAHWNICTGNWLRRYVYERVTPKGKKPGFPQLLFTQLVSAIWHGLYPGYLLFFATTALWINFSTTLLKAEMALLPPAVGSSVPLKVVKIMWTHLALNYAATPFLVLDFKPSLWVWSTVYYVPHLIMLLGNMVLPMVCKSKKSKHNSCDSSSTAVKTDGETKKKA